MLHDIFSFGVNFLTEELINCNYIKISLFCDFLNDAFTRKPGHSIFIFPPKNVCQLMIFAFQLTRFFTEILPNIFIEVNINEHFLYIFNQSSQINHFKNKKY